MKNYKNVSPVSFSDLDITGGFWKERQDIVRKNSIRNVYKRFEETGRFEALKLAWKEGMPNKPHIFFDSDVAKWIESVAYLCEKKREPDFEKLVDEAVDLMEKNRLPNGYFNSYFEQIEPDNIFKFRWAHELYCAGHLLEAAIAYKNATGKDKLFRIMKDYIDLIYQVFVVDKSAAFATPGHEEIELALIKLYRDTEEKKYLDLADYFIETRGTKDSGDPPEEANSYNQSHLPIREQKDAVGHSVRACYFYSSVADLAYENGDETLTDAVKTLFDSISKRRMYVTGGIGQTSVGEAFMDDYDLPNETAYVETCANLSLAMFARRMYLLDPDRKYADIAEKVLYNAFLSGISLDGKSFFYSNMQESSRYARKRVYNNGHRLFLPADQRVEVFGCSCCPPNVTRTIASIGDYQYTVDESAETLWVHQYMTSEAHIDNCTLTMETGYPYDGKIILTKRGNIKTIAIRIPSWCKEFSIEVDGKSLEAGEKDLIKGYLYVECEKESRIVLDLQMNIRFVEANPKVWEDCGRVAVTRGPLVYCLEGVDNIEELRDIRLDPSEKYELKDDCDLGVKVLETTGYRRKWDNELYSDCAELEKIPVKLIPYFAFANRGSTPLVIWTLKK